MINRHFLSNLKYAIYFEHAIQNSTEQKFMKNNFLLVNGSILSYQYTKLTLIGVFPEVSMRRNKNYQHFKVDFNLYMYIIYTIYSTGASTVLEFRLASSKYILPIMNCVWFTHGDLIFQNNSCLNSSILQLKVLRTNYNC